MRKLNSKFITNFISEEGSHLKNRDYFAFVELDEYACYVIADGIDEDKNISSAEIAVTTFIKYFTQKPTMNRFLLKRYLNDVNEEILSQSTFTRLKASITVVVTDYTSIRYCVVGNSRFYLFKDGYLTVQSKDESLTQQMSDKKLIPLDIVAKHSERNNLTSFLGQSKLDEVYISKKTKLCDKDVFALATRGIWENCDEKEIEDAIDGAKEPKEVVDRVEDLILSKQPEDLENYTLSITFADKVYINPERKKLIKKIILIAIPVILVIAIALVIYNIKRNKKLDEINDMASFKANAEDYIGNGNIEKANSEYKNALDIAKKYKLGEDIAEIDKDYKYTDIILQGDKDLEGKKYDDALDKYSEALDKSNDLDNIGRDYLEKKLDIVKNCINVQDLLKLGDEKLEADDREGAEENYLDAKSLALSVYLKDEKKEAMDKLEKIYQDKSSEAKDKKAEDEKKAAEDKKAEEDAKKEEEENKKKAEEDAKKQEEAKKQGQELQNKAIDLRKNGDLSYVGCDYVSAKMYYSLAKEAFEECNTVSLADELEKKIELMDQKINETADKKSEGDKYLDEANKKYLAGDYSSSKVLYLLAKDTYGELGLTDECSKVDEKLKVVDECMQNKK